MRKFRVFYRVKYFSNHFVIITDIDKSTLTNVLSVSHKYTIGSAEKYKLHRHCYMLWNDKLLFFTQIHEQN